MAVKQWPVNQVKNWDRVAARLKITITIVGTVAVVDFEILKPFSFYFKSVLYVCSSNEDDGVKQMKNQLEHFSVAQRHTPF